MKLYLGTLLLTVGFAAACSTNKPAEGAYDSSQGETTDPALAGASSETVAAADASHASLDDTSGANSTEPNKSGSLNATTTNHSATPSPAPDAVSDPPSTPATAAQTGTQPDNTKVNKRDTNASALTPMDQGNNETDLKITQQIRQAVMADGSLSFNAKNVKIITVKGKVTLRGPVSSDQERAAIESAAKKVAGATNVENQIEVKK